MKRKLNRLLKYIDENHASDVHFTLVDHVLTIKMRGLYKIVRIEDKRLDESFFHYLKFLANLDLGNSLLPQSGNFKYTYKKQELHFRLSYLTTLNAQSAVLRVLNNHAKITIDELSMDSKQNDIFKKWTKFKTGLVLVSGPTGSGKSTTLHALLDVIASNNQLNVITLEDPIEIFNKNYLQLQINEKMNFTYQEGIKQLLRHDPDVIMIGEIRDEETARTLIRCALSGHMVFTTIHSKSCVETIQRMVDFGVSKNDLSQVVTGITNQRIFKHKDQDKRVCIYELLEGEALKEVLINEQLPKTHADINQQIEAAVKKKWIEEGN